MAKIMFHTISINKAKDRLEIVFNYNGIWYRCSWDNVPEKYKVLYAAYLKLSGKKIPDYLKQYYRDVIDISDVSIDIDLDRCEVIPSNYPLIW